RDRQGRRRGRVPNPRRLRLLGGVRGRAALPRRAAAADRRGYVGDPADGHRPEAPAAAQDLSRPVTALSSATDTKDLIETGVRRFLEEVPALQPLKLVVGLELRGRGDVQHYRVELPGPEITKGVAQDARVRLSLPRSHFNELAAEGKVRHWREAFEHGDVKASGSEQILPLVESVVEKQEQR